VTPITTQCVGRAIGKFWPHPYLQTVHLHTENKVAESEVAGVGVNVGIPGAEQGVTSRGGRGSLA
jgi:hypothetical protein